MKKRILTILLTFSVFSAFMPCVANAEVKKYGEWLYYEVNEDGSGVTITQCDSSAAVDIVIPEEIEGLPVTGIGDGAFQRCSSITGITIPPSIKKVGSMAFSRSYGLKGVYITDLEQWMEIDFVDVGSSPTRLAGKLYLDGELITDLEIPEGTECIKNWTFYGCTDIKKITIPESVTSIMNGAFYCCTGAEFVTIPKSVLSIDGNPFIECGSLNINVDKDNPNYCSVDGVVFNKDKTEIVAYAKDKIQPSYTIPTGVKSIGKYAFAICDYLTAIVIPEGVSEIKDYAFEGDSLLTGIRLPHSLRKIGSGVFSSTGLSEIVIPDGVTEIGYHAFYALRDLYLVIPTSVESITRDNMAISSGGAQVVPNIYFLGSEEEWQNIAEEDFGDVHYNVSLESPPDDFFGGTASEMSSKTVNGQRIFTLSLDIPYIDCSLYAAAYDADGNLLSVNIAPVMMFSDTSIAIDKNDNLQKVRFFVWSDKLRPLSLSFDATLNEE